MQEKHTRHILRLYFGKHFSNLRKILFGRWLLTDRDSEEQEKEMLALWQESSFRATESTQTDWIELKEQIGSVSPQKAEIRLYPRWIN